MLMRQRASNEVWNAKMPVSYLRKHSMSVADRWFVLTSAE